MVVTRASRQALIKKCVVLAAAGAAMAAAVVAVSYYERRYLRKEKKHTSILKGQAWVEELLDGSPKRFRENMGMHKHVFRKLIRMLSEVAGLGDTRYVTLEEQLAIFLYTVAKGASNRSVQERFQRSGDTVSRVFHRILNGLTQPDVYNAYVRAPNTRVAPEIREEPKHYPFFRDAIAAIDGSHIFAYPESDQRARFRNRKGQVTMNVLTACTFDMRFCYILSGWEGSASDSYLFQEARAKDLRIPEGKYYLGDAGFASCQALLVPYRGVRYHLREWEAAKRKPETPKELFNLRHAQRRNVVERIFGVWKKRFPVIRWGSEYPIETQARLVPACAVLHNFIRIHDPNDVPKLHRKTDWDLLKPKKPVGTLNARALTAEETRKAAERRDKIAEDMWASYQDIVERRRH